MGYIAGMYGNHPGLLFLLFLAVVLIMGLRNWSSRAGYNAGNVGTSADGGIGGGDHGGGHAGGDCGGDGGGGCH